jgi:hypothetical protein
MTMQCSPNESDLAHAGRRGLETARAKGLTLRDDLIAAAKSEIAAAWPHLEPEVVHRAAEAVLHD